MSTILNYDIIPLLDKNIILIIKCNWYKNILWNKSESKMYSVLKLNGYYAYYIEMEIMKL